MVSGSVLKSKTVKIVAALFVIILIVIFAVVDAKAAEEITPEEIYNQLLEQSGAGKLFDELPGEARSNLEDMGVTEPSWSQLNGLSFAQIMSLIVNTVGDKGAGVMGGLSKIVALMLLCALVDSFKTTLGERPLSGIINTVSTMCICAVIAVPIVSSIEGSVKVIEIASGFMLVYVPIMAGIMISNGNAISGASYYTMMMGAGQVVSQISLKFLSPMLNLFLGLSVASGISVKINMRGICDTVYKVIKWVLGFVVSIFTTVLALQNMVASSADVTTVKAAKFALSNFVPVVGTALGDAFQTVQGCVGLLKSGVGVFAIIGCAVVFLPALIECVLWNIAVTAGAAVGDIFGLSQPAEVLRACSKVLGTMLAILFSCMTVFIISTTIIILLGGSK